MDDKEIIERIEVRLDCLIRCAFRDGLQLSCRPDHRSVIRNNTWQFAKDRLGRLYPIYVLELAAGNKKIITGYPIKDAARYLGLPLNYIKHLETAVAGYGIHDISHPSDLYRKVFRFGENLRSHYGNMIV